MPNSSQFSPLESLLLFQHLYSHGITLPVFTRIADQLKNDPHVRASPAFDAARLNPDALRDFFLRIFQDEAKQSSKSTSNPDSSNASSSQNPRKRKAPSPSLPSIQDAAKNDHLLPQLIVKLYARYREQAVSEIKSYERDYDKLSQELVQIERGDWDSKIEKELEEKQKLRLGPVQQQNGNSRHFTASQSRDKSSLLDHDHTTQRTPSPTSTTIELPKTVPRHPPPQVVIQQDSQSQGAQATSSSSSPQSPYRTPTPGQPHPPYAKPGERPSSPLVQNVASTKPAQQLSIPPGARSSQGQSPRVASQSPTASQRYPTSPYGQAQNPTSGPSSPAPARSNQQLAHTTVPYPSQRGGIMLQPFQVSPQIPTVTRHQQLQAAHQQATTPIQARGAAASPRTGITGPSTPITDASKVRPIPDPLVLTLVRELSTITPVTSPARWKNTPPSKPVNAPPSPTQPRSVSPMPEQLSTSPEHPTGRTRRQRQDHTAAHEQVRHSTRSSRAPSSRRIRGVSTASSVVGSSARGRTRSHSVTSHVSGDDSASKVVKHEPPSTPMDTTSDVPVDDTPMPAPPRRGPSTRNKRKHSETVASEAEDSSQIPLPPEPQPKTTVLAVRNFPRLSNTIMMDVTSHRHASTFSAPVRERDADGYSSMIRWPTDLKTIKVAIQAGARAFNNASAAASAAASSEDATATALLLPWSTELVPPKAIVNSAQLERELMRMFANAVMFNPGEDDVVRDAREMFDDAVVKLGNFREAERGAEQVAIAAASSGAAAAAAAAAAASSSSGGRKNDVVASMEVDKEDSGTPPVSGKRRKIG
jgi:Bromodomain